MTCSSVVSAVIVALISCLLYCNLVMAPGFVPLEGLQALHLQCRYSLMRFNRTECTRHYPGLYIVMSGGVCATKITVLDWIYWPFFVRSLLITSYIALLLIYTLSSPLLHLHQDSQSPQIVSWQWISTQKLSLQITVKSACHFIFNHLGMPTQF
jgi:hypothetical protein